MSHPSNYSASKASYHGEESHNNVLYEFVFIVYVDCVVCQVDYAMDVFKQLYHDSPDPEGEYMVIL